MDMNFILWLVLVIGYGLFTWAAGKRDLAKAALCFLDGGYLAFLCLLVLPDVMATSFIYYLAGAIGIGIVLSVRLEERLPFLPPLVFAIVTGCQLFWREPLSLREYLFLAVFGGIGLYHASSGIIPEKVEIRNGLLSASGFLVGTFLFAGI